ncbi:uncharacterized protein MONBRDRAFT_11321 [Monosiga brevicollis MX1]|uniref:VCBS repeat-containing protein n=1 Tax=Monosiga brevicollis TaxID=81824 RepID=A9V8W2_MONBE|nr:uncharacterized protein MONBRDRAFT_11321 [Monosiga brevicollis MX1]EDQ85944.1 predicted protein [Monosiga brevicollis MX1]|eukprot:XP_001749138.1 hypothetical protein [Monosiga brevicollis MX1]
MGLIGVMGALGLLLLGAMGADDPLILRDDAGHLHIQSGAAGTVLVQHVDVLAMLERLDAQVGDLEARTPQARARVQNSSAWTVSSIGGTLASAFDARFEDLDGDGRRDIVVVSFWARAIVWYRSLGAGAFQGPLTIAGDLSHGPRKLAVADFDQDGRPDVVATSEEGGSLTWYRNEGGNPALSFSPRAIVRNVLGSYAVQVADVDEDGWLDVVCGFRGVGHVAWFRNAGNGTISQTPHVISNAFDTSYVLAVVDLNQDGHVDVLFPGENDATEVLFGDGTGNFTAQPFNAVPTGIHALAVSDINHDGRPDVAVASFAANLTVWYAQVSSGDLWAPHELPGTLYGPRALAIGDLDKDGAMDLVVGAYIENRVVWYRNLGQGTFEDPIELLNNTSSVRCVLVDDMDGDGDLDVLAASYSGQVLGLALNPLRP